MKNAEQKKKLTDGRYVREDDFATFLVKWQKRRSFYIMHLQKVYFIITKKDLTFPGMHFSTKR